MKSMTITRSLVVKIALLAALVAGVWSATPQDVDAGVISSSIVTFEGDLSTTAPTSALTCTLQYLDGTTGAVIYQLSSSSGTVASRTGGLLYTFEVPSLVVEVLQGGEWSFRVDARRTAYATYMDGFQADVDSTIITGYTPSRNLSNRIGEGMLTIF